MFCINVYIEIFKDKKQLRYVNRIKVRILTDLIF